MPQNKKTPESDNPDLTPEELALIEGIVDGLNYSDAYKRAYNAVNYSRAALGVQASRKVAEPQIQRALAHIESMGLAKLGLKHADALERRIAEEYAFFHDAKMAGNFGAAGGAYDRVNKLLGLYVERHADVTETDPLQTIKEIAEIDPKLATELAHRYGIVWQSVEEQESDTRH